MRVIRNFFRHVRDGFKNLFRNSWMTLLTVMTMTISLVLVGLLVFIVSNINALTYEVQETIYVQANIKSSVSSDQEQTLKITLENMAHVERVVYSDKEEQLAETAAIYGDTFKKVYDSATSNPLLNAYRIYVDDAQYFSEVNDKVKQLPEVEETVEGSLQVNSILKVLETIRVVVALIAAIFVVLAVLLISNTIRLTIMSRSTEIEIMRLVGATNGHIRAPFSYEGFFIGVMSGALATGILFVGYEWFQIWAPSVIGFANFNMVPTLPILFYIAAGLVVGGIILGVVGARRSMRQYLKI